MPRNRNRHFVVQCACGEKQVVRPGTIGALVETVDVMHRAHPVLSGLAKSAIPAWHDLLADRVIADLEPVFLRRSFAQRNDLADKFVSRSDWCLAVAWPILVSPK